MKPCVLVTRQSLVRIVAKTRASDIAVSTSLVARAFAKSAALLAVGPHWADELKRSERAASCAVEESIALALPLNDTHFVRLRSLGRSADTVAAASSNAAEFASAFQNIRGVTFAAKPGPTVFAHAFTVHFVGVWVWASTGRGGAFTVSRARLLSGRVARTGYFERPRGIADGSEPVLVAAAAPMQTIETVWLRVRRNGANSMPRTLRRSSADDRRRGLAGIFSTFCTAPAFPTLADPRNDSEFVRFDNSLGVAGAVAAAGSFAMLTMTDQPEAHASILSARLARPTRLAIADALDMTI
jgi:hypothetical protein